MDSAGEIDPDSSKKPPDISNYESFTKNPIQRQNSQANSPSQVNNLSKRRYQSSISPVNIDKKLPRIQSATLGFLETQNSTFSQDPVNMDTMNMEYSQISDTQKSSTKRNKSHQYTNNFISPNTKNVKWTINELKDLKNLLDTMKYNDTKNVYTWDHMEKGLQSFCKKHKRGKRVLMDKLAELDDRRNAATRNQILSSINSTASSYADIVRLQGPELSQITIRSYNSQTGGSNSNSQNSQHTKTSNNTGSTKNDPRSYKIVKQRMDSCYKRKIKPIPKFNHRSKYIPTEVIDKVLREMSQPIFKSLESATMTQHELDKISRRMNKLIYTATLCAKTYIPVKLTRREILQRKINKQQSILAKVRRSKEYKQKLQSKMKVHSPDDVEKVLMENVEMFTKRHEITVTKGRQFAKVKRFEQTGNLRLLQEMEKPEIGKNTAETFYNQLHNQPDIEKEPTPILDEFLANFKADDTPPVVLNMEVINDLVSFTQPWKACGFDCIPIAAFKMFHSTKEYLLLFLKAITDPNRNLRIPKALCSSSAIMLYKKGDKSKCENYRIINLLNAIYKLTMKFLNGYMTEVLETFIPVEQVSGRSGIYGTLVGTAITKAMSKKYPDHTWTYIDYTKAFDSILLSRYRRILQHLNIDKKICGLLIDTSYKWNFTIKNTIDGNTNPIHLKRGILQGCSLSPKLFCMVKTIINLYLREKLPTFKISENLDLNHVSYADDCKIFTTDLVSANKAIGEISKVSRELGLEINFKKSAVASIGEEKSWNHQNLDIPIIMQAYRYLGMEENIEDKSRIIMETFDTIKSKAFERLQLICSNNLNIPQIVRSFNHSIIPMFSFILTHSFLDTSLDSKIKKAREIDKELRMYLKQSLKWMMNFPNAALYSSDRYGGMNLKTVELECLCSIFNIRASFQKDPYLADLSPVLLEEIESQCLEILATLKITIDWNELQITSINEDGIETIETFKNANGLKRNVWNRIYMANEECMRSNWSETSIYLDLIKQNKIILPTTRCLKELPDTFQRRQLLLFRMNTEISHITNQESKCPFCQEHDTREHILNGCQSETMGNLYTKRHNLVVNILVRNILNKLKISSKKQLTRGQMKQYGNITVYYDRPIATEVSSNKPDVIIITNNEGIILEVAVSGYTTMNTKRMEKIGKYTPLESDLTSSHKKQFKIYAIVIGSNGELDVDCFNEWIKVMEHYKINKKWSKNILNTIRQKVNAFSDYLFRTYLSMKQQINMETNEMAQF